MSELISIVTPLYNYKNYIGDLIKSVLEQDYENWEHLIVDDGSTDNPQKEISKFNDKRIKYINLKKNYGYSKAKNEGILAAKGEYIVMIDADDMLTPTSLSLRYNALNCSDKLWVHGECLVLGESNKNLSEKSRNWKRDFRKKCKKEMDLSKTYHHRLVHAQSVMVKKEIHRKLGLYDENIRCSSDNEMWRRFIKFGCIPVHIDDFVAIYRVHPKRMSRSNYKNKNKEKIKKYVINIVEKRFKEGINLKNTRLMEK
jgi:glycosyltransferase involved in cell wall biosynthesis